jgi:3-isopropylmalate/(R)-2-methylmalate dehydratase small subunit
MEPFRTLEAATLPIAQANVDTDQILPARFLSKPRSDNFGAYLFRDLRKDPAFPLNQPQYRDAKIVVAGRNFACGSSREHAVWALHDHGIRVAIAPSFGDIFSSNALKNGFLPIVLPEKTVEKMLRNPGKVTVNLEDQTVTDAEGELHAFDIAPFAKKCLLEGVDELGYTLSQMDSIVAYERQAQK